jgi:hypothetical protein
MGQIYNGIHQKIALKARDLFSLEVLVETGTYRGATALWAKDKFKKVATIELSPNLYKDAVNLVGNAPNVLMIQGDTRDWLPSICKEISEKPTLFWIDSHPMPEAEQKDPEGCPILDELNIINSNFFGTHVIMVDDYFAIELNHWADSGDIIRALEDKTSHDRKVRIIDDIYFAAPKIPDDFEEWKK